MTHFDAQIELADLLADAFDEGYTDSEASYTIDYRGYSFEITLKLDKSED